MVTIEPIRPVQVEAAKRVISTVILELFTAEPITAEAVARMQRSHQEQGEFRDMDEAQSGYFAPGGLFLVLLDGEAVVGTGALRRLSREICEVKRMWVLRDYRGQGFGRRMLNELLDFARKAGYTRARLDSHRTMTQAHRLYARSGFYPIERYNNAPADQFLFMEKRL